MQTTTVIEFNSQKYKAEISKRRDNKSTRKSRLFVFMDEAIENATIGIHPEYTARGADLDNDKAWDAYNRKLVKLQKQIALSALNQVGVEVIIDKFTRYAGCTCPCSPGFVLAENGYSYFVSIDVLGDK